MSTEIIPYAHFKIPKLSYEERQIVTLRILRHFPRLENPHLIVGCTEETYKKYVEQLKANKFKIVPHQESTQKGEKRAIIEEVVRTDLAMRPSSADEVAQVAHDKYHIDISTSHIYQTLGQMGVTTTPVKTPKAHDEETAFQARMHFVVDFVYILRSATREGLDLLYIDEIAFSYSRQEATKMKDTIPHGVRAFMKNLGRMRASSVSLMFALSSSGFRHVELVSDVDSDPSGRYVLSDDEIVGMTKNADEESDNDSDDDSSMTDDADISEDDSTSEDFIPISETYSRQSRRTPTKRSTVRHKMAPSRSKYAKVLDTKVKARRKVGRPPGSRNKPKDGWNASSKTTNTQRFTTFIEHVLPRFNNDAVLVYDNASFNKDDQVLKAIEKLNLTSTTTCPLPPYTYTESMNIKKDTLLSPDTSFSTFFHRMFRKLTYYTRALLIAKEDGVKAASLVYNLKNNIGATSDGPDPS